jgi:hypothetical protein
VNKELEKSKSAGDDKIKDYSFSILMRFFAIFALVFLSQIPGCLIVLADDPGQISYFDHETLIEVSKLTFAFPQLTLISDFSPDYSLQP